MGESAWGRGGATAVCLVVLVVSAGCGGLTGSESLSFTASNATIDDATLSETAYSRQGADNTTIERSIEIQGETRTLRITNHVSTYVAEYRGAPLAHAVLLATPKASAFGQGLNPLGRTARTDLVERATDRAGDLAVDRRVDNRTIETLGQEATVTRYAATASGSEEEASADVYVLLLRVTHEGDYVIAAITYPRELEGGLAESLALLRNIEH
jgi:hypothetical protein